MKRIATLFLCALALFANAAAAQQVQIGFIDGARIERESKELQRGAESLKQEFAAREREVSALDSKVGALRAELDTLKPGTPPAELEKKQREFTLNFQRLEQARRNLTEDVEMRKTEELKKFYANVRAAVEKVAQARNLDLVLQEAIFVSSAHDITEQVIKMLNAGEGAK